MEKLNLSQLYRNKIYRVLEKFRLLNKITDELSFHLGELAEFSPKYKKMIDTLLKQKTKQTFINELFDEIYGELLVRHEVEGHLIPAANLLTKLSRKLNKS